MIKVGEEIKTQVGAKSLAASNSDSVVSNASDSFGPNACNSERAESPIRSAWIGPILVILFACTFLGGYCCELNQRLYTHHQPFYDSLSYNEKLFRVMTISREAGFLESLETACFSNNTNSLPFLVAAAIAPVISPSRLVGIWIQTGLLFLFLISLYYFLVRIKKLQSTTALAGCLTFLGVKCIYLFNGGLSDFRMDLSLYLGFALTSVWYLTSMELPTKRNFLMLGVSASICCLFRATAPIYLVFALAPICFFDLFSNRLRKEKLIGLVLATVTVILLAGWFFILNLEFLKFYYLEWNTDANAKIPLYDAFHHLSLTRRSVGEPMILMLFCWVGAAFWHTFRLGAQPDGSTSSRNESTPESTYGERGSLERNSGIREWLMRAIRDREIDWRIAWIGLAPVVMMIARRAGLNPFVTMPCVFGLVLFFALPALKQMDRLKIRNMTAFCWTIMFACIVMAAARGWVRHSPNGFETMAMNNELIDTMLDDTRGRKKNLLTYGVVHLTDLNSNSLYSTLLFDRADGTPALDGVTIDEIKIKRIATFSQPAATDWRNLPGETDDEKISGLIADANNRIDYLILPDKETAKYLETAANHNFVNRFLVQLRQRIVDDDSWFKVGRSIKTNDEETVEIYRKAR
ncbi:MAG: hypothetical protein AB8B55_07830 [Mariniblastus sp.]